MVPVVTPWPVAAHGRWPLAGGLLLFFVVLAAVGVVSLRGTGGHLIYPDDGYIAMAGARQLRAHGLWGVTPFEFSGSVTSLAWTPMLAAWEWAAGSRDVAPFALNVLFGVAVVALAQRGLSRHVADARWQLAALALIVVATPLPALALLGMEHSLQCLAALALALAAVRACSAGDDRDRRRLIALTAVCAAAAVATRYDIASVLAGVLIVTFATLGWRPSLVIASCAAVPPALYAAVAWRHGWPAVPVGVLLKTRLPEFGSSGIRMLRHAASGVIALADTPALAALVIGALVLLLLLVRAREPEVGEPRLLVTVFLIAALLHVQFGRTGYPFRYEAYLIALGIVANVAALAAVVRRLAPPAAIVWAAIAIVLYPLATRAAETNAAVAGIGRIAYEHEYQQGVFLARHPQPGPVMLVDLGAIAYLSDLRLVDLGGLGSLDVAQLMLSRQPGWTSDALRRLATVHDAHVAIDVQGPLARPAEWIRVAAWESPGQSVEFFAIDAATVPGLVRDLRAYERDLPPRMVLRVFVEQRGDEGRD